MPFRILAGLVGLVFLAVLVVDPVGFMKHIASDLISLVGFFLVIPTIFYAIFIGKLPDALVKRMSDDMYKDIANTETLFKNFDARSIGAAIVVLIMGCYMIISRSG